MSGHSIDDLLRRAQRVLRADDELQRSKPTNPELPPLAPRAQFDTLVEAEGAAADADPLYRDHFAIDLPPGVDAGVQAMIALEAPAMAASSSQCDPMPTGQRATNTSPVPCKSYGAQVEWGAHAVATNTDAPGVASAESQATVSAVACSTQTDRQDVVPVEDVRAMEQQHASEVAALRRELEHSRARYAELERGFGQIQQALQRALLMNDSASRHDDYADEPSFTPRASEPRRPTKHRDHSSETAAYSPVHREPQSVSPRLNTPDDAASLDALLLECDRITGRGHRSGHR